MKKGISIWSFAEGTLKEKMKLALLLHNSSKQFKFTKDQTETIGTVILFLAFFIASASSI